MLDEQWMMLRAGRDELLRAVRAHFEAGPLRPARPGEPVVRRLDVFAGRDGLLVVRESGATAHRDEFLPRWLCETLYTPVHRQVRAVVGAEPTAHALGEGGVVLSVVPFAQPDGEPVERLVFALDLDEQRAIHARFEGRLARDVASLFPLPRRDHRAVLQLEQVSVDGPDDPYREGMARHEKVVRADLSLQLLAPARDSESHGLLTSTRREKVCLARHDVLTPRGGFIVQGEERVIPADEHAAGWLRRLERLTTHIVEAMNERTDWGEQVTPRTLVDAG